MSKKYITGETIDNLSIYLEKYVKAILKEYGNAIPINKRKELENISDYKSILVINPEHTVSFYCCDDKIFLPQYASEILDKMKFIPGFGINKKHKCYKNNEILNNTSYLGYIAHVVLKGLDIEDFCLESLLHETVHLCGSDGIEPFREGLTELKAREIAQKYGFPLSRCGYNKEVNIVSQVQDILGRELITKIAFTPNESKVYDLITQQYSSNAYSIIAEIRERMNEESRTKYDARKYQGTFSAIKKATAYDSLNYSKVLPLIEDLRRTVLENEKTLTDKESNRGLDRYKVFSRKQIPHPAEKQNYKNNQNMQKHSIEEISTDDDGR
ncbi:MAG: hypothetical protein IJH39_03115 [Clostridia bacterium]|nr:hypothetical protein [Clostridia bacterium]